MSIFIYHKENEKESHEKIAHLLHKEEKNSISTSSTSHRDQINPIKSFPESENLINSPSIINCIRTNLIDNKHNLQEINIFTYSEPEIYNFDSLR
jgi:hypothetical protein